MIKCCGLDVSKTGRYVLDNPIGLKNLEGLVAQPR